MRNRGRAIAPPQNFAFAKVRFADFGPRCACHCSQCLALAVLGAWAHQISGSCTPNIDAGAGAGGRVFGAGGRVFGAGGRVFGAGGRSDVRVLGAGGGGGTVFGRHGTVFGRCTCCSECALAKWLCCLPDKIGGSACPRERNSRRNAFTARRSGRHGSGTYPGASLLPSSISWSFLCFRASHLLAVEGGFGIGGVKPPPVPPAPFGIGGVKPPAVPPAVGGGVVELAALPPAVGGAVQPAAVPLAALPPAAAVGEAVEPAAMPPAVGGAVKPAAVPLAALPPAVGGAVEPAAVPPAVGGAVEPATVPPAVGGGVEPATVWLWWPLLFHIATGLDGPLPVGCLCQKWPRMYTYINMPYLYRLMI